MTAIAALIYLIVVLAVSTWLWLVIFLAVRAALRAVPTHGFNITCECNCDCGEDDGGEELDEDEEAEAGTPQYPIGDPPIERQEQWS